MKVTVTAPAVKLCPYRTERDEGTVELTFDVEGDAPELHQLAEKISGYAGDFLSHEDFTRDLVKQTGAVRAISRWRTAGLDVTCDLSRESDR